MQDELLIRRAQRGDADAFEQLLLEHQKNVYNLCYRMAGDPDDAMDLSQETFLRAWRCLDQYQFASAFSTWLYRLCSNICIDFLRKRRRHQTVPLTFEDADGEEQTYAVPDAQPLPEEQVELKLTHETLAAAMAQLLPEHRAVLQSSASLHEIVVTLFPETQSDEHTSEAAAQYARDNACAVLAIWDCASLPELADSNGRLSDGGWVYPVDAETLETLLEQYRDVYPMESYAPDGAVKTAAIVLYEQ